MLPLSAWKGAFLLFLGEKSTVVCFFVKNASIVLNHRLWYNKDNENGGLVADAKERML